MRRILDALSLAGGDTLDFFRRIGPGETALWLAAGCFVGWNGLQLLYAEFFIYLFVDHFSLSMLTHRIVHSREPWLFYLFVGIVPVVFWLVRAPLESLLLARLRGEPVAGSTRRGLRFGGSSLFAVGGLVVALAGVFLLPYAAHLAFRAYPRGYALSLRNSLVFAGIEGCILAMIFFTFLVDFVLPLRELGFHRACTESYRRFRRQAQDHLVVYVVRLVSILFSIGAVVLIMRGLLFPVSVAVSHWIGHSAFKGFDLYMGRWVFNLVQLLLSGLFVLMCASPVFLPFWVFQRFFIRRLFADRYTEY
jgi:hypothetical protein